MWCLIQPLPTTGLIESIRMCTTLHKKMTEWTLFGHYSVQNIPDCTISHKLNAFSMLIMKYNETPIPQKNFSLIFALISMKNICFTLGIGFTDSVNSFKNSYNGHQFTD